MELYGSNNGDCHRAAFANLLLCKKDSDAAKQVYDHFSSYKYVLPSGIIHVGLSPHMLSELTNGKYLGILYDSYDSLGADSRRWVQTNYGNLADEVLSIMEEQQRDGRIVAPKEGVVAYLRPAVLVIKSEHYFCQQPDQSWVARKLKPWEIESHCIVDFGDKDRFIDSGRIVTYNRAELYLEAVFELDQ